MIFSDAWTRRAAVIRLSIQLKRVEYAISLLDDQIRLLNDPLEINIPDINARLTKPRLINNSPGLTQDESFEFKSFVKGLLASFTELICILFYLPLLLQDFNNN